MNTELLPKVVVPNELLNASYDYTTHELDLLCRLYSEIRRTPANLSACYFHLSISELADLLSESSGRRYEYLRAAVRGLISKPMEYYHSDSQCTIITAPLSACTINPKAGRVEFFVLPQLCTWIRETKKSYTEFDLYAVLKLRNKYSKRIYLHLRQWLSTGIWYTDQADLRALFEIDQDKYTRFEDFKKRILKPALEEINAKTELSVKLTNVKNGRTIEQLCFQVVLNEAAASVGFDERQQKVMEQAGLAKWQILNVFMTLAPDEIAKALYDFQLRKDSIKNKAPYLVQTFVSRGVPMNRAVPQQLKIA